MIIGYLDPWGLPLKGSRQVFAGFGPGDPKTYCFRG